MDEGNKDWSMLIKSLTAYEGFQTDDSLITRGEWMPDYTFYSPEDGHHQEPALVTRTTFDLGENETYIHFSFCVENLHPQYFDRFSYRLSCQSSSHAGGRKVKRIFISFLNWMVLNRCDFISDLYIYKI